MKNDNELPEASLTNLDVIGTERLDLCMQKRKASVSENNLDYAC